MNMHNDNGMDGVNASKLLGLVMDSSCIVNKIACTVYQVHR